MQGKRTLNQIEMFKKYIINFYLKANFAELEIVDFYFEC